MIADTADAMEEDGAFQGISASPLLSSRVARRRCSGCSIQSSVNRVRSTRPIWRHLKLCTLNNDFPDIM
jgi:hypothetical protein